MKILLVTDQYFSANNGMTISSQRFYSVLTNHGHEVRIVSTGQEGDTPYRMEKQYIPFFDDLITSQGMVLAKPNDKLLLNAIQWADIVHFLSPFALTHHGILLARKYHIPYTAAFHVQPENISSSIHMGNIPVINSFIYHWFRYYIYRYCSHIHCPSRFIATQLKKNHYPGTLHVFSNGIDPAFVYRKLPKKPEWEKYFIILMIGRYSIEKKQNILIDAVAKSKYANQIQLILAGQGPRKAILAKQAKKLPNPIRMQFFSKSELLDILAMSDLYVHAADAEIEAMSCMEAFSSGLVPIIADSKRSATPQFALDKRSLFPANNSNALAKRIDYWIEHEKERKRMEYFYSESAKQYNLEDCVKQAENMFETAIKESRI